MSYNVEKGMIKNFDDLENILVRNKKRCRVAVVNGYDESSQKAIYKALDDGFAEFYLVGDASKLKPYESRLSVHKDRVHVIDVEDDGTAAATAVNLVRSGGADCIMKGIISTDVLLKAVLNKDNGIIRQGKVLTHIGAMKIPTYDKMLFISDVAVIPFPTIEQRIEMIKYAINVCHDFGIRQPRIALIHCTEKISQKFPITLDYKRIMEIAGEGKFGDAIIYGPMDVKCACNKEADDIKGLKSPVDGKADVLIMPDIEAANAFYKAMTTFTDTVIAAALQGAECPVALTSRSDSATIKFNSLAMACLSATFKNDN